MTNEEIIEEILHEASNLKIREDVLNLSSKLRQLNPKRTREPYKLPTVKILDTQVDDIAHYEIDDFVLENYKSHPKISFPLSN